MAYAYYAWLALRSRSARRRLGPLRSLWTEEEFLEYREAVSLGLRAECALMNGPWAGY